MIIFSLMYGQEGDLKTGMIGAKFMAVPVGARASAMGEAFAGVANDASAVFWNVGGISRIQNRVDLFVSHTQWPAGIQFESFSLVADMRNLGKVAFSGTAMHMGEMRVRTAYSPEGTGETFTVQCYTGGISWGRNLTDKFSLGLTLKGVQENYYTKTSNGFSLDVGSLYDTQWKGLKIGMAMTNFGGDMAFDGTFNKWYDIDEPGKVTEFEAYPMPLTFRFGLTMDVMKLPALSNDPLLLAVDMIHHPDNIQQVNFGLEYNLFNLLALRSGYKYGVDEGGLTFGVGLKQSKFIPAIDYSYGDFGRLGNVSRFSIILSF